MFKRIALCLLMLLMSACPGFAALSDADEAADGLLEVGEYDGGNVRPEYTEKLIVQGGGANRISARDYSEIRVEYTSVSGNPATPVTNSTGIWDIVLFDNSSLLFLEGAIDEITVGNDATAELKGGYIDAITIYHFSSLSSQVTIHCQKGYQKDNNGISGLWADGTSFDIGFNDVGGHFSAYPTGDYVFVEIVPEPATLALFGIGGLLIRRKKQ